MIDSTSFQISRAWDLIFIKLSKLQMSSLLDAISKVWLRLYHISRASLHTWSSCVFKSLFFNYRSRSRSAYLLFSFVSSFRSCSTLSISSIMDYILARFFIIFSLFSRLMFYLRWISYEHSAYSQLNTLISYFMFRYFSSSLLSTADKPFIFASVSALWSLKDAASSW